MEKTWHGRLLINSAVAASYKAHASSLVYLQSQNRNGGVPSEDVNEWTVSLFTPDSVNRLSVFDRGESPAQPIPYPPFCHPAKPFGTLHSSCGRPTHHSSVAPGALQRLNLVIDHSPSAAYAANNLTRWSTRGWTWASWTKLSS